MVVPGKESPERASVAEVAAATLRVLRRNVPAAVPGIVFLSGGQGDQEATAHLQAMNGDPEPRPWPLTFSYGRALQHAVQQTWKGKSENVAAAQRAFSHRAEMNGLAALGQWKKDLEKAAA
jgi:fructose-bisphosphate aldolase class I